MGANPIETIRASLSKAKTVFDDTFEHVPTHENYYLHTDGSLFPTFGNAVQIKLKVPAGNYEIEAIVRLFNNGSVKRHYGCHLNFFLDDEDRTVWEGGEIGPSEHTVPHVVCLKAMATFTKSKTIKFSIGCNAPNAFNAENASLFIRRVGSISYKLNQ